MRTHAQRVHLLFAFVGDVGLQQVFGKDVAFQQELIVHRQRVERACAEGLPRFKRPKRVVFFASLPRTATGKVQRFVLRDLARVEQRADPHS